MPTQKGKSSNSKAPAPTRKIKRIPLNRPGASGTNLKNTQVSHKRKRVHFDDSNINAEGSKSSSTPTSLPRPPDRTKTQSVRSKPLPPPAPGNVATPCTGKPEISSPMPLHSGTRSSRVSKPAVPPTSPCTVISKFFGSKA
ncbi:hypothetical protein M413DRAFT_449682 [Hebeloma cylindrosporum]|uniref:Uncharacterized protein n=1 Tax=Hebeloma cylindrosporum TaxID=76867 RepID=A0A0C3BTX1_HEBCY|nr:hypothetical protein M413DRAFT_449682 [Hebeloma cylindrosporum h7]